MTTPDPTRLTISWSKDTDLGEPGMKKGDLLADILDAFETS